MSTYVGSIDRLHSRAKRIYTVRTHNKDETAGRKAGICVNDDEFRVDSLPRCMNPPQGPGPAGQTTSLKNVSRCYFDSARFFLFLD